ncbi:hypothetical protein ABZV34_36465, partial [Streptomyces sp. NPDC005195]|uniref:hypothetical protein n=1 Tax=Streptomyces sp. NPDC005195 TaxID=3154561 RepID=UPI0033A678E4
MTAELRDRPAGRAAGPETVEKREDRLHGGREMAVPPAVKGLAPAGPGGLDELEHHRESRGRTIGA